MTPQTLLDRLWARHEILRRDDGASLLWVDRHLVHEGSHHAFAKLADRNLSVARPDLTFAVADHYAPSGVLPAGLAQKTMIARLADNAASHKIAQFTRRQGIVHVIGPELGLTLPGLLVVCGDSHTSTHGALGALAFGIGATEVAHVLATQTVWQRKPRALRLTITGQLGPGVTAKDIALSWIARFGADGARGHAVEYAGPVIDALSVEARLTLCNLSIEGGARCGMIAPDAKTLSYLANRPFAPANAPDDWAQLRSDPDARFDRDITLDVSDIAPVVTWGTSPDQTLPITATVPAADDAATAAARTYMALSPGAPLAGTPVDQVFIGSCTNGRIEDLRAAAAVLSGRRARIPGLVAPGSVAVRQRAEAEGLHRVFTDAGLTWGAPGCSMCVGMNGDIVAPGKRCASTTNRNFRGRQGPGARTHLMSPAMVAAAAVTGMLSDVRPMLTDRAT